MNFLKIAWRDISAIFKNRFIRVSVVAIIIVPLLYSLLYLYAFWNPYDKLSDMPVAVVNQDKGGVKDGKDVNYGKDVVDKLKENNKIGWRFVDYNDAKNGVEGKKYYAMFVIPSDFTENALTVEKKDMIQPKIYFTSNDKRNFLASQINGKVVVELKAEITKNMTKEVDKVLFDNLNEIKDKMQLAADGSKKLSDGNGELAGKIPEMKDGVGKLYDGSGELKNGLATLNGSAPALKDGVSQLYGGSTQLKDGLGALSGNVPALKDGVGKLYDGSSQLEGGLANLNGNIPEMKDGIGRLSNGANTMADGIDQAKTKVDSAVEKINENKQLFSLINVDNVNKMKKLMDDANKLQAADTSMLSIVNKDNIAFLNKTTGDLAAIKKMLGIDQISADPATQKLVGSMIDPTNTQANFKNINNLVKDLNLANNAMAKVKAEQIPVIQKSIGNLMSNSDKLNTLLGTAENIPDLSALNPLLTNIPGLMDNSDKLSGILNGASQLNGTLEEMKTKETQDKMAQLLAGNNPTYLAYIEAAINGSPVPNKAELIQLVDSYSALVNVKTIELFSDSTKTTIGKIATLGTPNNIKTLNSIVDVAFPVSDPQKAPLNGLVKGYEQYATSTLTLLNQTNTLTSGLAANANTINITKGMLDGITNYRTSNPTQYAQVKGLITQVPNIEKQIGDLKSSGVIGDTKNLLTFVNANKENLTPLIENLGNIKTDLDNNAQALKLINVLMTNAGNDPQAIVKIQNLQGDLLQANELLSTLNTTDMMKKLNDAPALVDQLTSMQKELKDNSKIFEVAQNALNEGNVKEATALINAIPSLTDKVNALADGSHKIADGLNTLNSKMPDLADGTNKLHDGSLLLKGGLGELNGKVPALADGANQLYVGSLKLNGGLGTLNSSVPALADGANKLYNGSLQLNDGLGTLNGKMPDLLDGTTKLKDGSKELSDKLADGSNQMNGKILNDSDTMSEFLSKPVDINEKAINAVKNYGTGFAPYFISLSLYVGVMLMFFVITEEVDEDIKANPASVVLGKFLSYGIIGVIQAVLASTVVVILGLQPANMLLYFLFNVFSSFVFIAIVQSFVFLLGHAGRLLSIVLLILQLTACAGTFPLEVVPKFFKVLNPFMPFTYTVEALRELISGVDYSVVAKDTGILAITMVTFVIISVVMKGHADKVKEAIQAKKEAVAS